MKTISTLAALVAATLAAPAMAQNAPEPLNRVVRVADLNLADPAHVDRLNRRIGQAARAMCDVPSAFDLETRLRVRDCIAQATSDAAVLRDRAVAAAAGSHATRTASR